MKASNFRHWYEMKKIELSTNRSPSQKHKTSRSCMVPSPLPRDRSRWRFCFLHVLLPFLHLLHLLGLLRQLLLRPLQPRPQSPQLRHRLNHWGELVAPDAAQRLHDKCSVDKSIQTERRVGRVWSECAGTNRRMRQHEAAHAGCSIGTRRRRTKRPSHCEMRH